MRESDRAGEMNRMTDFIALEVIEGAALSVCGEVHACLLYVNVRVCVCVHVSDFLITLSISGY